MNTFDMIDIFVAVIIINFYSVVGFIAIENNCKISVVFILIIQAVIAYIVLSWIFHRIAGSIFRSFTMWGHETFDNQEMQ